MSAAGRHCLDLNGNRVRTSRVPNSLQTGSFFVNVIRKI